MDLVTHLIPHPERPEHLRHLLKSTSARVGVWRSGSRPLTSTWLRFRQDHAMARDAVHSELSETFLQSYVGERGWPVIQTLAFDRRDFVLCPPRGKRTSEENLAALDKLCPSHQDVQIVISDGLSAKAVEAHVPDLLAMIEQGLQAEGISYGLPIVVRFGRVAIGDQIGGSLNCRLVVNLIGERPGLTSAEGLSAYLTYNPGPHTISSDRTVVSNIHSGGTPPVEAGAYIVQLIKKILNAGVSGVRLQQLG